MEIERKLGESKRAVIRQNMQLGAFALALLKQFHPKVHSLLHELHLGTVDRPEDAEDECRRLIDELLQPKHAAGLDTDSSAADSVASDQHPTDRMPAAAATGTPAVSTVL